MTVISCKIISMKAERLISILLLLQTKKGINTRDLAEQLGVSIRTIFRDLQELNANGFPLYSEHGPGGGVYLVEGYNAGIKNTLTKVRLRPFNGCDFLPLISDWVRARFATRLY
jgi:predicted DNA-binding transcriptional regulator YafY